MIHEKWVISDHHLFHDNTWKLFKGLDGVTPLRPFTSTEEMHKTVIQSHNAVVQPNDYVYMLGDLSFKYGPQLHEILSQLNGRKRFVFGNHDDPKKFPMQFFEKINGMWMAHFVAKGDIANFTMSHGPQPLDQIRWGRYNVHGHTHAVHKDDPHYINTCVEPRNYTPVNFSQIIEEIKQRES